MYCAIEMEEYQFLVKHPELPIPSSVNIQPNTVGPEWGHWLPKACHKYKASMAGDQRKGPKSQPSLQGESKIEVQVQRKAAVFSLPASLSHLFQVSSTKSLVQVQSKKQLWLLCISLCSMYPLQVFSPKSPFAFLLLLNSTLPQVGQATWNPPI